MSEREAVWSGRQPLEDVRQRQAWRDKLVLVCHCLYSSSHVARVIHHAKDYGDGHLGDAWLVQFKVADGDWGNTSYIFADMIYPLPVPAPIQLNVFESWQRFHTQT